MVDTCRPNKNKVTIIRNVKVIKSLESKKIILMESSQTFFTNWHIPMLSEAFIPWELFTGVIVLLSSLLYDYNSHQFPNIPK